jgi:hypothetical protein
MGGAGPKYFAEKFRGPLATRCCSVKVRGTIDQQHEFDDSLDQIQVADC